MNKDDSQLASTLVWDDEGCLTEVAISVMSDGELELLPAEAAQHIKTCAYCANLVGQSALFSLELAAALPPGLSSAETRPVSQHLARAEDPSASILRQPTDQARASTREQTVPHLASLPGSRRVPRAERPPALAIALALVLAFAGLALRVDALLGELSSLPGKLAQLLPDLTRLVSHGFASGALRPIWIGCVCVATALLLITGLVVARLASRGSLQRDTMRGGLS